MSTVGIDTERIVDWPSFHADFASALGFPEYYGKNMNAWVDCLTSLDNPDDGLTTVHAPRGGVLVLDLGDVTDFADRHAEQYDAIVECSAYVNWRRLQVGEPAVVALSFHRRHAG